MTLVAAVIVLAPPVALGVYAVVRFLMDVVRIEDLKRENRE